MTPQYSALCTFFVIFNINCLQMDSYDMKNESILSSPAIVKLYSEYVRCKMKTDRRLRVIQSSIGDNVSIMFMSVSEH